MESPSRALTLYPPPPSSPPPHSLRRRSPSDPASSPEFEFWNIHRNPDPIPLHSADELFSHGVLLPLQLLSLSRSKPESVVLEPDQARDVEPDPGLSVGSAEPSALITSEASSNGSSILSASKRWKEIFKRGTTNNNNNNNNNNNSGVDTTKKAEKKSKKEKKNSITNNHSGTGGGNNNSIVTELNINIWPFSRSRSAGNNSNRSNKPATSNRKVSSAPCSRSNSSGESNTSRKSWPSSPGRPGVHVGRASPVWLVKKNAGPGSRMSSGASKPGRALKPNVPVCIGYRQQMSCRTDDNGVVADGGVSGGDMLKSGGGNGSGGPGNLFGLRGLFSKKSGATVLTV